MSPRDFTDEHKRSKIPTLNTDLDPRNPFCTDLNLVARGPVAQMRLPQGWRWGEKENSGAHRYSFQNFYPEENSSVLLSFFFRGALVSETAALCFSHILKSSIHDLSDAELDSISEILQDKLKPEIFDRRLTRAKTLNGKRILVLEGFFKHIQEGRLALYIPADSAGAVVQEIIYQAPISLYAQFRQAACNAFDSIVWV
ncbi:MAG: hypothetical protein K2X27_01775 [Candidatus Obscuribacterales bacterium]|nr:hypothetical protein [Candidatus Obscuribacterales bacterium]